MKKYSFLAVVFLWWHSYHAAVLVVIKRNPPLPGLRKVPSIKSAPKCSGHWFMTTKKRQQNGFMPEPSPVSLIFMPIGADLVKWSLQLWKILQCNIRVKLFFIKSTLTRKRNWHKCLTSSRSRLFSMFLQTENHRWQSGCPVRRSIFNKYNPYF